MTTDDLEKIRREGEGLLAKVERIDRELDDAMEAGDRTSALAAAGALADVAEEISDFDAEHNGIGASEASQAIVEEMIEQYERMGRERIFVLPGEKKREMFSEELAALDAAHRAHAATLDEFFEALAKAEALEEAISEDDAREDDRTPEQLAEELAFEKAMSEDGAAGADPLELKVLEDLKHEAAKATAITAAGESLVSQLLDRYGWEDAQWAVLVRYKARLSS